MNFIWVFFWVLFGAIIVVALLALCFKRMFGAWLDHLLEP